MGLQDSPHLQPIGQGSTSSTFRLPRRIFVGAVISPESLVSLRFIKNGVVAVGSSGIIRFVEDLDKYDDRHARRANSASRDSSVARTIVGTEAEDCSKTPKAGTQAGRQGDVNGSPLPASESITSDDAFENTAHHDMLEEVVASHGWELSECEIVMLSPNSFLSPGFIDTHVHAPQMPNVGRGQEYELLDWLENITFPREKKFEDTEYAYKTYDAVIQRMLDAGTTCAAIYATLHEEATMILADICNERGMRAFVGKCQMDRNSPQDYVEKTASASMDATRRFVEHCRNLKPFGSMSDPQEGSSGASHRSTSSSGSREMDESIARLTATMNRLVQQEKVKNGDASADEGSSSSSFVSTDMSEATKTSSSTASEAPAKNGHNGEKIVRQASSMSSRSSASGSIGRGSDSATARKLRAQENANALVQPILTPRFAISCSDALLASISAYVSRDPTLRIQTHLSENGGEIAFTKSLFPFCETYTDVYDHFSLLTPRTILAHAIHLEDYEMELIAERKCGISHCPTSNMNLRSGTSRVGEMLNRGIKVGLGTDMSGGFGLSILSAIRDASVVAKVVQFSRNEEEPGRKEDAAKPAIEADASNGHSVSHTRPVHDFCKGPLPIATLFYMATLGGAEVCSIAHRVGSLDPGKEFDALLINTDNGCPNLFIEDDDTLEQKFEKMLFCGDDRNIASVFVRGRVVGGSAPIAESGLRQGMA